MGKQLATAYRPVLGVTTLVLVGLLLSQFISLTSATSQADNRQFAQKVNLALRRTAHHLLVEQGDSTSRIQPVQQPATNTFSIRLERPFAYGRVPHLLQESFAVHAVGANYDVSILDCATRELQLGYNYRDLIEQHEIPCGGRQQGRGCYTLQVTFALPETIPQQSSTAWLLVLGGLLAGVTYGAWHWSTRKQTVANVPVPTVGEPERIQIGRFSFDVTNQTLALGAERHQLTYREAKLLHLFATNLNQLLERELILKSVWEDEGIIVGRSVDVFVSRLRKLLRDDPTVRIAAVHGVGYRFDVQANTTT